MYYAPHCTFDASAGNLLYNALRAHKYYALVSAVHTIHYYQTSHPPIFANTSYYAHHMPIMIKKINIIALIHDHPAPHAGFVRFPWYPPALEHDVIVELPLNPKIMKSLEYHTMASPCRTIFKNSSIFQ